jgi:hypothetical protein
VREQRVCFGAPTVDTSNSSQEQELLEEPSAPS